MTHTSSSWVFFLYWLRCAVSSADTYLPTVQLAQIRCECDCTKSAKCAIYRVRRCNFDPVNTIYTLSRLRIVPFATDLISRLLVVLVRNQCRMRENSGTTGVRLCQLEKVSNSTLTQVEPGISRFNLW